MLTENYRLQLEQLLEDNDLTWSSSLIGRLSRRANDLQFESDFTLEDIFGELNDLIPASQQDDDDVWTEVLHEFASFIEDEKENNLDEQLTEPEED